MFTVNFMLNPPPPSSDSHNRQGGGVFSMKLTVNIFKYHEVHSVAYVVCDLTDESQSDTQPHISFWQEKKDTNITQYH